MTVLLFLLRLGVMGGLRLVLLLHSGVMIMVEMMGVSILLVTMSLCVSVVFYMLLSPFDSLVPNLLVVGKCLFPLLLDLLPLGHVLLVCGSQCLSVCRVLLPD